MVVTINTDAAFHTRFKVAAFAFWMVSDEGRILHSGALKGSIKSADEAEIKCIINAIAVLVKQNWRQVTRIIINTDSLNAIHVLGKNKQAIVRYGLKEFGYLRGEMNRLIYHKPFTNQANITFNHIRSHEHTETARNWVNNWCDENAKKCMWEKINNAKR